MELENDLKKALISFFILLSFVEAISAARTRGRAETPSMAPAPSAETPSMAPAPSAETPSMAPAPSAETPSIAPAPSAETPSIAPALPAETPSMAPAPSAETPSIAPVPSAETPSIAPALPAETPSWAPASSPKAPSFTSFTSETLQIPPSPLFSASGAASMNSEVKKVCDATDYSSLCQSSVFPLSTGKADAPTLLQLAIKAAIDETISVLSHADKLANAPDVDDDILSSLDDCKSSYESLLSGLQTAQDAISQNDKGTINSMLSAAISDIGSCDDGLSDSNPVATFNQKLTKMTSNCLAIAALIK